MPATDEKIAHCVAYYRVLLDAHTPDWLSRAPDSRLHVIVRRGGVKRRSKQLLVRLDQAFSGAWIKTYPRLTDPVSNRTIECSCSTPGTPSRA